MARKPKAPKPKLDRAQEKARKQKRLAAVLSVFLVAVLAFEVPHTMKLMSSKAKAPVVEASSSAPPEANPTSSTPVATPSSSSSTSVAPTQQSQPTSALSQSGLVSSVQPTADEGQLTEFARFASKDPFLPTIQKTSTTAGGGSTPTAPAGGGTTSTTSTTPSAPKTPPAPPPTSAVISLNGELMPVQVGGAFPASGVTFDRVGSIFQLDALTAKTAKVSIVGGSYADGASELTLTVGKPVTLQNTADGSRYTLILEAQGTQIPNAAATPSSTTTPATTTTTPLVVPSSSNG